MIRMPLEVNYQSFLSIERAYFDLLEVMQPDQSGLFRFLRRNGADATKLLILGASKGYMKLAYEAPVSEARALALKLKFRSNRLSQEKFEEFDKIFWRVEIPKSPDEVLKQYYENDVPVRYNLRRLQG